MTEKLKAGMQFFLFFTNWIMVLPYTLWRYDFTIRSTFTFFLINTIGSTIENQTPWLYFICFSLSEFSTLFVFLSKFYDVIFADSVYLKVMCEYVYNLFEQ
jgi:hypothetical protein